MSRCIRGGLIAAVLAALVQAPAFAISSTTVTSPLTRGVTPVPAAIQRADGNQYTPDGVAVMLAAPNFRAHVGAPEAMAREFLAARHADFGLTADDAASLVRTSLRTGSHFSVVRFGQRLNGIPVYGSNIAVSVMPNGKVFYVSNATVPGATPVAAAPATSQLDALAIGTRYLGIVATRNQKAERMIYVANGTSRLVWRLRLEAEDGPRGDWEVLVDAATGDVVRAEDKAAYEDGTGTIWTPDPLSETLSSYNDPGYTDGNNADTPELTDALVPVTLEGITFSGGNYTLVGQYAVCQDFDTPHDAGCPSQASSDFSVTRSAMTFDAVMGYWHLSGYLKYVNETLGVVALPLNHPGGVHYDPHGFQGADNSQYSSGGENITYGQGGVDDAQDADVLIHELGHGIHDWITNGNLSQNEGLSEGVGDYNASGWSRDFPGQWTPSDTPYFWTFNWDGHNPFWPGRVTNYELTHTYAQARNQEIHIAGQYWASCNLLARDVLGGAVMDKAYFEGLSATNSNTNQQAAAQAVINAAAALGYSSTQIAAIADAYNSGNAGGHAGCTYNVTVPDASGPSIDVSATSLTGTANEGDSDSTSFTIGNTGDATLTWNIDTSSSAACTTPASTPWLSFAPPSGSIASGGPDTTVNVTMDAAALTAGEYTTFACVHSNDAGTPVVAIPVTFTVNGVVDDTIFVDGFDGSGGQTCAPLQLFQDPSFEATVGGTNAFWTASDSVSGTNLCDSTCDSGATIVARTGEWFVWFGGWDQQNTSLLSQSVVFPAGQPRWLNYWMNNQISGDATAVMTLSIDGTSVFTFPAGGDSDYVAQTFEIPSAYLDGQTHLVQWDWSADSPAGEVAGAIMDDVTLDCSAQPTKMPPLPVHRSPASRRVH
ncbi:MAG TPA: hypothetical protein VKB52_07715 [Rhodanobacteraceae bacterium]|nr:hypothetical protein [Rhodanobacteraceae bacterium]